MHSSTLNHLSLPIDPTRLPLPVRLARRLVFARLERLTGGRIILRDDDGEHSFGDPTGGPTATVTVQRPRFYRRVVLGGDLGAADAWIDGDFTCDHLVDLLAVFVRSIDQAHALTGGAARVRTAIDRVRHWLNRNTRTGSRRNIAAHYDLGNDFFRLFLDESMTYSCGIFEHPDTSLADAQFAKLDLVCRKLRLTPDTHLLETGTGWGSLALHAARHYGCRVTTTTISREQHRLACERVADAGLDDRITCLLTDYRDLDGTFDRIASIEMIEAVGLDHLSGYFRACRERLADDGMMLAQVITTDHRFHDRYRRSVDFIRRDVFPGSHCPSLPTLLAASEGETDLAAVHVENIGPHYAHTLHRWRDNFHATREQARQLGATDSFLRLWDYYLAYCEAGYRERYLGNVQVLWAPPACRVDDPTPTAPRAPQPEGASG
ncbi:MAG: cyclopropane-fatty-acyl-phospholipid synthase family protein [Phycisphaeraceae bacterium]|nr:cyclopropane-fatty-acyl-phospholipid synthase family protein [Phycisphaeraceae bacterium]